MFVRRVGFGGRCLSPRSTTTGGHEGHENLPWVPIQRHPCIHSGLWLRPLGTGVTSPQLLQITIVGFAWSDMR